MTYFSIFAINPRTGRTSNPYESSRYHQCSVRCPSVRGVQCRLLHITARQLLRTFIRHWRLFSSAYPAAIRAAYACICRYNLGTYTAWGHLFHSSERRDLCESGCRPPRPAPSCMYCLARRSAGSGAGRWTQARSSPHPSAQPICRRKGRGGPEAREGSYTAQLVPYWAPLFVRLLYLQCCLIAIVS